MIPEAFLSEALLKQIMIPFAQSLLYDISKHLVKSSYSSYSEKKLLNSAIRKGVITVFGKKNDPISDSIIKTIQDQCDNLEKCNIYEIVKREFEQWNEENWDPDLISVEICNNIAKNIISTPELREKFTSENVLNILNIIKNIQNDIKYTNNSLHTDLVQIISTQATTIDLLYEILNKIQNTTNNILMSKRNSKYIPDSYKNYFLNPLFLEKNSEDKKIATLKDVYIENTFKLLDFPYHNDRLEYNGLIQFITNFVTGHLLENNYHTPYSLDSNNLRVLFIKGHPGSGKSSLFYLLSYLKAYDETFLPNYQFIFVKLIEVFDYLNGKLTVNDPLKDIEDYIGDDMSFSSKTVIVLDGLDEICVAKNLDINEYCNNLIRVASRRNSKVRVIITTRLNYINITNRNNKNVVNIQLINLTTSQLKQWCKKYFKIHSKLEREKLIAQKNIEFIQRNAKDNFVDIYAVPLLFYMIVASRIDVSKINHIGELYDQAFEELKERNYNESETDFIQKHAINNRIPEKLARQIAIEISYQMYKSNKLLLKIDSKELQIALDSAISTDYSINNADKKDIELLYPITFFYKESVDVVEFAHKSIMEFFVAEKMYQAAINHYGDFNEFVEKFIINPIIISNEVMSLFTYFINKPYSKRAFENSTDIIFDFRNIIRSKKNFANKNILYPYETSKIIFKTYWYFIRKIIKYSVDEVNELINDDLVKKYIIGTLSIIDSGSIPFLDNRVINLDFSKLTFSNYDFSYCNLEYSDFSGAALENCKFIYSNLDFSKLTALSLAGLSTYIFCNLNNIDFEVSQIKKQDRKNQKEAYLLVFKGCSFDNAVFRNTDISHMNFDAIVSMNQTRFNNVKMLLGQFIDFSRFTVLFKHIEVIVKKTDFTDEENEKIRKQNQVNRDNYIIELTKTKVEKLVLEKLMKQITFIVEYDRQI